MPTYQRVVCSITVVMALITVSAAARGVAGQKGQSGPKGSSVVSVTATFNSGGIQGDALGPSYSDGVDGVSSILASGTSTTSGWAWDLAATRTSTPRQLFYDLTHPADDSSKIQGVFGVHTTNGQVFDLSTIQPGYTAEVHAHFYLNFSNRIQYVLMFGKNPGDGSAPLLAMNLGNNQFWVHTDSSNPDGDIARYQSGSVGTGVLVGFYHVPVDLTLKNQQ